MTRGSQGSAAPRERPPRAPHWSRPPEPRPQAHALRRLAAFPACAWSRRAERRKRARPQLRARGVPPPGEFSWRRSPASGAEHLFPSPSLSLSRSVASPAALGVHGVQRRERARARARGRTLTYFSRSLNASRPVNAADRAGPYGEGGAEGSPVCASPGETAPGWVKGSSLVAGGGR